VRSEECGVRNDNKNKCSVKTESQSNSHSTLHTPHSSSLTSKLAYLERKEQQKKMKRVEKSIKEVEGKITQLENRIKELDDILCTPEGASDMTVVTEYTSIKKLIDQETERWERLCEEMEEMKDFL
jgi:ATP-binding cassette subfamily F protein 3